MIHDYTEESNEPKQKSSNRNACFYVIFGLIMFFSLSIVIWSTGAGYWRLMFLTDHYVLQTDSQRVVTNTIVDEFDYTTNSTFLTSLFGSKITYFEGGLLKSLLGAFIETWNLANPDGSVNVRNSQFSVVTNSQEYGYSRGLCQDHYGNIGINTFDRNGTQCIPKAKCDCGGNLNVLTNVTVDNNLSITTQMKTITCNNTSSTQKVLQFGSENTNVVVIKANQQVLIETTGQVVCFNDLIRQLNNLTNTINLLITKNNLTL